MKSRTPILCLILAIHAISNGQTTDHSNFLNGLVSAYSLESSSAVTDELGINNGTVTGATLVQGNIGNALNFTGSQATMATVPTSPSLDLDGTELTFMVDIYPTANGQSGRSVIFQKGVGTTGDNIYSVSYRSDNKIRFRNYVNGVRRDFISTTIAPLNTWSRILCVWKSGEPKIIRINSANDTEANVFTGTQGVSPDRDMTFGSYDLSAVATARSFTGRIDNVIIWDRALTTEEQNTLINENLGFSDFQTGTSPDTGIWSTDGNTAYYNSGNVAIGRATVPAGYHLAVEGKIRTREVRVDQDTWPDYVFSEDYGLMSLEEIKDYIEENGHLPKMPSAKDVKSNGIELGEMNKLLLEKIEELTLYILEQERKREKLEKRITPLEKNKYKQNQ